MDSNAVRLLRTARAEKRCITAFNIYDTTTLQAAFSAAETTGIPVIVALGESYLDLLSLREAVALTNVMRKNHPGEIILHLDHCRSEKTLREAVDAGFDSVMFDGSRLPFAGNISRTKSAAAYAHAASVSIEGELGGLNDENGEQKPGENVFTSASPAAEFVQATEVDSLAVSIGNAHGLYHGAPHLDFSRLEAISTAVDIPLVLHGCSGIPKDQLLQAIRLGVSKINVNTEIAMTGAHCALEAAQHESARLESMLRAAKAGMLSAMEQMLRAVGQHAENGRAGAFSVIV